jgi:hypothetical protein
MTTLDGGRPAGASGAPMSATWTLYALTGQALDGDRLRVEVP